jgi:hypothetical protein
MFLNFQYLPNLFVRISLNTLFVLVYLLVTIKKELPLHELPVIGKYFRK